ncbi:class I SAM-dependent methyltransferase [Devosia albogilva]|uniref:Class I SAM-dependent methyltransferase n=1 Tax=Devosia albogilva TaxID=429726 RepID=A0ABW5QLP7_9HYPH
MIQPNLFIREHLRLGPVPGVAGVEVYQAHSGSRLSRLGSDAAPYWAYAWGGGVVLAQYLQAHPELVAGRRVLDLGAGSGLVGIVAAQLGPDVAAAEIDPFGRAAVELNAAANGVCVALVDVDIAGEPPAGFELILAGDVFYDPEVAAGVLPFLQRCREAGTEVLIGDPQRRDLPVGVLEPVFRGVVTDMGGVEREAGVYRLKNPHPASP